MKVKDVMSSSPEILLPEATIAEAARKMVELDCGFLPIGENDRLIGTITDRDIAIRAVAHEMGPHTRVRDVMSEKIRYCFDDQDTKDALHSMEELQIRRLAVLNRNKRLIGVVSLGDLSKKCEESECGETLREISKETHQTARAA